MNDKLNNVTILPPFKKFCMTIGELPSSYLESMTYYESLLWLTKYLGDTVIPALNANGEAVIELQEKYIELKNYVDNYFENLDIQTEINNKLDDMADSGELVEIISAYLTINSILGFDNKDSLKAAENLIDGCICKTIGNISYNDGKGNFYKIRNLEEGDIIDDNNLVGLTNFDSLVAEKLPDYRMNQVEYSISSIEDEIDEINNEFKNNKNGTLNLTSYITYDFGKPYYIQGLGVNNTDLYVYKEYSDSNGKLMKFNLSTNTYTSEASVDLKHGNDITIINNVLYSANTDSTKKISLYNLSNSTLTEKTLNVDESQIACLTKDENDNLLVLADNDYGANFSNCGIYKYDIENNSLTKLTVHKNMYVNFYAIQSMVYLKGYLYLLVSNPNQIIKLKVDGSDVTFESIYNIPDYDRNGLSLGEVEGIDLVPYFGDNAIMISAQILDCSEIGRTMKTYIINPINNTPADFLHYPDINYREGIESVQRVYVNNTSSLIELGTQNYPFHTLNRAINSIKNLKDKYDILLYNTASQSPFNLHADAINSVKCAITAVDNNITINYGRILNSDILFSGNNYLTLKNTLYSAAETYGNIMNNKLIFDKVTFDVRYALHIFKSNISFYEVKGTANNSENYVMRIRYNSTLSEGINWNDDWTLNGKKPYQLFGVSTLFKISDLTIDSATQSAFVTSSVDTAASNAYCIIFAGKHTTD